MKFLIQKDPASGKVLSITKNVHNRFVQGEIAECDFDALAEFKEHELFFRNGKIERGLLLTPNGDEDILYNQIISLQGRIRSLAIDSKPQNVLAEYIMEGKPLDGVRVAVAERKAELEKLKTELTALREHYECECHECNVVELAKLDAEWEKTVIYPTAVCLITKDENDYLDEFIRWHVDLGFDHIFVYDNESEVSCQETVDAMGEEYASKVTVTIQQPLKYGMQAQVYRNFIAEHGHKCRWVAFIDTDELLDFKGKTIQEFLKTFDENVECGAVHILWQAYSAGGKALKEQGTMQERFADEVNYSEINENYNGLGDQIGKNIIRLSRYRDLGLHHVVLRGISQCLDAIGNSVSFAKHHIAHSKTSVAELKNVAVVRHYYTKSLEEWIYKMVRGNVSGYHVRKAISFMWWNPDMDELTDRVFKRVFGEDYENVEHKFQERLDIDRTQIRWIIEEELAK